jgi:hypothetical protein
VNPSADALEKKMPNNCSQPSRKFSFRAVIALIMVTGLACPCAFALELDDLDFSRRADWSQAGYPGDIPDWSSNIIDVRQEGAIGDGLTDDHTAIQAAIDAATTPAVIFFPSGRYKIGSVLHLKSGIVIRGEGSRTTHLEFTSSNGCFDIVGAADGSAVAILSGYSKGSNQLVVDNVSDFEVGQGAEIQQENIDAVDPLGEWNASWGKDCIGQMVKIEAINGNTVTISPTLNFSFSDSHNPEIIPVRYIRQVGIEDLAIHRFDTGSETNNVNIRRAADIWIRRVESDNTEKYHISVSQSLHTEIRGSYIHDAFRKGGGGQGYGASLGKHATAVLVENNIFSDLRHAMIVQLGTNGSVFGYNYAQRNYSDVAGEGLWDKTYISVHGHYAYMNLFEGNIVGYIGISDYWGPSGPGNTIFRNRCMGTDKHADFGPYRGIAVDDHSHYQNVIANELIGDQTAITFDEHADSSQGTSTDPIVHGNNIHGSIQWDASYSEHYLPASFYLVSQPAFLEAVSWPTMGPELPLGTGTIPAKIRYDAGRYVEQPGKVKPAKPEQLQILKMVPSSFKPD